MLSFKDRVAAGGRLVFDGGMGVSLFSKGLALDGCPEVCNLENPEWIRSVSSGFKAAGANVLQTNTFGASPLRLSAFGLESRMEEINRRAAEIARAVAGEDVYVSASIGPSAARVSATELYDSYCRQARVLKSCGVDGFIIETMSGVKEALAALRAARDTAPELPAVVTLVFKETPDGIRTLRDEPPDECVNALLAEGAAGVGSNCGAGIDSMLRIARELRRITSSPLLIQPSAGVPSEENCVLVFPETPEYFEPRILELLDLGVQWIGGCCGTTPEHIRIIRQAVDRRA